MMIRILEKSFDPANEFAGFERKTTSSGGVVCFLGKVRPVSSAGAVETLYLEHYPGATECSIAEIAEQAKARWAVDDLLIIHRVGSLSPGEPIVLVCAAAAHRRDAFAAADFLMDYLKTEALFWKKEKNAGGEAWIEPRGEDYQDAARWRKEEK